MDEFILDKNSKKIEIGDILKIFHFTGARRKRFYMHKQVIRFQIIGGNSFYRVSHLDLTNNIYYLRLDDKRHNEIEIVDSLSKPKWFEDREKININKELENE